MQLQPDRISVVQHGSPVVYALRMTCRPTEAVTIRAVVSDRRVSMYPDSQTVDPNSWDTPKLFSVSVDASVDAIKTNSLFISHSSKDEPHLQLPMLQVDVRNLHTSEILSSGDATFGELGRPAKESQFSFDRIRIPSTAKKRVPFHKISSGARHSVVIDDSGRAYVFGDGSKGQLGLNSLKSLSVPALVNKRKPKTQELSIIDVASGEDHNLALDSNRHVLSWGNGQNGKLGHCTSRNCLSPIYIGHLHGKRVRQIGCGAQHSVILTEEALIYSWGLGSSGALGHGTASGKECFQTMKWPRLVQSMRGKSPLQIACGDYHTCVLSCTGQLYTAGWEEHGRLGRPCVNNSSILTPVDMGLNISVQVSCGGAHTAVLTEARQVYTFGENTYGQLGVGDQRDRVSPVRVLRLDDAKISDLELGKFHSMALSQEESLLYVFGLAVQGQCGLKGASCFTLPRANIESIGLDVTKMAAGANHSLLLTCSSPQQIAELQQQDPDKYSILMTKRENELKKDARERKELREKLRDIQRRHASIRPMSAVGKSRNNLSKPIETTHKIQRRPHTARSSREKVCRQIDLQPQRPKIEKFLVTVVPRQANTEVHEEVKRKEPKKPSSRSRKGIARPKRLGIRWDR